jgi:hypothetical protein
MARAHHDPAVGAVVDIGVVVVAAVVVAVMKEVAHVATTVAVAASEIEGGHLRDEGEAEVIALVGDIGPAPEVAAKTRARAVVSIRRRQSRKIVALLDWRTHILPT